MNHLQRYLAEELAEDYQDGRLSRRQALKRIAAVTGSLALADSILAACAPPASTLAPLSPVAPSETAGGPPAASPAAAQSPDGTVMPDDPAITAGPIQFSGGGATLLGYQARPVSSGPFPVVLVCHENRGLTEHIQDVTRRFGKAGYAALAVDLLSRQGGSAAVGQDNAPGALGGLPPDQFVQDFRSGWQYLQGQAYARAAQVGMVGFCFGGGITWLVAEGLPELRAAVPFYGPPPPVAQVPNIRAAVLAIYGALDTRITSTAAAMETAMQQNQKVFEKVIYPNADHAFFNDTGPRYNAAAAQDAWGRTLAWLAGYL